MNNTSLFSAQWHRVCNVKPRLASDVIVCRHVYRGRAAYVLHRASVAGSHRLDAMCFSIVDKLDGETSLDCLWEQALVEYDEHAPTQDELIGLIAELHAAELIAMDRRVTEESLFERRQNHRRTERHQRYLNPLYLRFCLHDPERWLVKLKPFADRLFSKNSGIAWLTLVFLALFAAFSHGEQLWLSLSDPSLLSTRNMLLFVLIYPCLKLIHECAHALAVKRAGGAVHEMGIALMVFLPLPYVDASESALFADKYDRMLVSAAGILVELACAAVGVLLWVNTGGILQEIGLLMFVIGGVSTLLLNGNPLLKFDGYFLLADWIEIPNLAARSRRTILGLLQFVVSGKKLPRRTAEDRVEIIWLYAYGFLSTVYRTLLMLTIAWMLSERWLLPGLILAVFIIFVIFVKPLWRGVSSLVKDPVYHSSRSFFFAGVVPASLVATAIWLPLPHSSVVPGVVWVPDEAVIRVSSDCEINEVFAAPGDTVRTGELLFACEQADAQFRVNELVARIDELQVRRAGEVARDPLALGTLDAELRASKAALADSRERMGERTHVARLDGLFDVVDTAALRGRSLARGDVVGYVIPPAQRTVRMAINERWISRFENDLESLQLRVNGANGRASVYKTAVVRRTPKATHQVTSAALSSYGGGIHEADPDGNGLLLKDAVFDVELQWPEAAGAAAVGSRVGVRLVYTPTPFLPRLTTVLRQALSDRVPS